MNPPKRLTDPSFRYTSAGNTDIRKTFERIRWEMKRAGIVEKRVDASNVTPLRRTAP